MLINNPRGEGVIDTTRIGSFGHCLEWESERK